MTTLVTGGSGFVGLNLLEQLLSRGEDVVSFSAGPIPSTALDEFARLPGRFTAVEGDVADEASLRPAFEHRKIDRLIHAAAVTAGAERDSREPRRIVEVNLIGTLNVLSAARDARVKRVVHASTGAVYGPAAIGVPHLLDEELDRPTPATMYGITKYAGERSALRLAELWGLDLVVGRLAIVYGRWEYSTGLRDNLSPPLQLTCIASEGGEAVFPRLAAQDWIYAPDVARSLVTLLDASAHRYSVYHLGTEQPWRLLDWCERLRARHPKFRYRESAIEQEWNPRLPTSVRAPFSMRRLREDTGFAPRYPMDAAFDDYMAWLEHHPEFLRRFD